MYQVYLEGWKQFIGEKGEAMNRNAIHELCTIKKRERRRLIIIIWPFNIEY